MTKKILIASLWVTLAVAIASAQTIIPGGNVSGTWTAAGSPYWVQGSITVPAGLTLTIEPAVEVEFQGDYSLTVNGFLEAVGTEADSIHFFPADTSIGWGAIRFMNAPDSSHLAYCTVWHAGMWPVTGEGGIYCSNSNPVITHCTISDNRGDEDHGGGIGVVNGSGPEISHCTITGNLAPFGGGMYFENSQGTVTDCIFSDNGAAWGGGGYFEGSEVILTDCILSNSSGVSWGGGIYSINSSATLTNCIISDNSVGQDGGGIYFEDGDATLIDCNIAYNVAENGYGGGIYSESSDATLTNCSFFGNDAPSFPKIGGGIACQDYSTLDISYCTFWQNESGFIGAAIGMLDNGHSTIVVDHCTFSYNDYYQAGCIQVGTTCVAAIRNCIFANSDNNYMINVSGTLSEIAFSDFYDVNPPWIFGGPAGVGELTQVNSNGDSCDIYFNIAEDPLFEEPGAGNFQITWANFPVADTTKSPCIDAGDPAFALDPDGTVCDMGALYFDQRAPDIELSVTQIDFGIVMVGEQADLPLMIYNVGGDTLELYDIFCGSTAFTTDWNPADSLALPGDSMEITVTFAPDDTLGYADTLCIDNNCEWCTVDLLGQGEPPPGIKENLSAIPEEFTLNPPYPNPFNTTAKFRLELPLACFVSLRFYDLAGRNLNVFNRTPSLEGWYDAGVHEVVFDAPQVASGIYFCRIEAGDYTAVRKMVLMK